MSPTWDRNHSFDLLADAVNTNDKKKVRELIQNLVAYVYRHYKRYNEDQAGSILNVLRRRRLFDEMRQAADAFLNNECSTFKIRKYYAQSLIDLGYLAAAEDVLHRLKNDTDVFRRDTSQEIDLRQEADKQWEEACGLLGRVHKDRYVNANAPDVERNRSALNLAIKHYYDCYAEKENKKKKRHWHGINAVALARLAKHDDIPVTNEFDVLGTAETILKEVTERQLVNDDLIDIWAKANAMEASIALKNWEDAYSWAKKYVDPAHGENVDAFEVAGTLRQLEEVWKLNINEEPGKLLIPLLRTRLQSLEGFNFLVLESEPTGNEFLAKQADSLEKQFGGDFLSFRTYSDGISRAQAVARIGPSAEEHFGTGFLIDANDLININHANLEGKRLLVTCDHVVSNTDLRALRPNRAIVTFRADDNSIRKFNVRPVLWSRPEGNLDVSILSLEGDTQDLPVVPWAEHPPVAEERRVLIFGHAVGGALSFSLGDNRLIDRNNRFFQYRAPTVGGSSGSPVFNTNWELIAVHHRGGFSLQRLSGDGTHEVNQGSSVFAIREELNNDPQLPSIINRILNNE